MNGRISGWNGNKFPAAMANTRRRTGVQAARAARVTRVAVGLIAWVTGRVTVRVAVRVVVLALLLGVKGAAAQSPDERAATPPVGMLLVAHPELTDRNFARTVVLVTRTPAGETIGVILNRRIVPTADTPADTPLVPALPEDAMVREVYFGGPLAPRGLMALGAATGDAVPQQGAIEVLPEVYLVAGAARVRGFVQQAVAGRIKVFAGYAGWAPGQLESEIARGGWRTLPATEEYLFDAAPESLWERLSARLRAVRCDPCAAPGRLQGLFGAHVFHPVNRAHVDLAHLAALQHLERHRSAGAAQRPQLAVKRFE